MKWAGIGKFVRAGGAGWADFPKKIVYLELLQIANFNLSGNTFCLEDFNLICKTFDLSENVPDNGQD